MSRVGGLGLSGPLCAGKFVLPPTVLMTYLKQKNQVTWLVFADELGILRLGDGWSGSRRVIYVYCTIGKAF